MSDAGVVRLLLFRVGNLLCATEAERVREILPRLEPTRIPGAPPVVAGVVNVRGTLVTLVEGWRAVRQRSEEHTSELQSLAYLVCRAVVGRKKLLSAALDECDDRVEARLAT